MWYTVLSTWHICACVISKTTLCDAHCLYLQRKQLRIKGLRSCPISHWGFGIQNKPNSKKCISYCLLNFICQNDSYENSLENKRQELSLVPGGRPLRNVVIKRVQKENAMPIFLKTVPWVFLWFIILISPEHFDKNYRISTNLYAGNYPVLCNIMVVSSWKRIMLCLAFKE